MEIKRLVIDPAYFGENQREELIKYGDKINELISAIKQHDEEIQILYAMDKNRVKEPKEECKHSTTCSDTKDIFCALCNKKLTKDNEEVCPICQGAGVGTSTNVCSACKGTGKSEPSKPMLNVRVCPYAPDNEILTECLLANKIKEQAEKIDRLTEDAAHKEMDWFAEKRRADKLAEKIKKYEVGLRMIARLPDGIFKMASPEYPKGVYPQDIAKDLLKG